jgi:hemerythrin
MDRDYILGIEEIDAQHREIHEVAAAIAEAVESRDKWHLVHYIVVRLHELLRIHFAVEESVMRIVGYPEIEEHKQVHRELLQRVERLQMATLSEDGSILDQGFAFLPHILGHDKKLGEFIAANVPSLRR